MPDGPWIDVTLFYIGGVAFTRKTIIIASGGIAGIIIAIIVICCICSWWKRKQLAETGRRISTYV